MTDQFMFSDPMAGARQRLQTLVLNVPDLKSFPSAPRGVVTDRFGAPSGPTPANGERLSRTDSGR